MPLINYQDIPIDNSVCNKTIQFTEGGRTKNLQYVMKV